MLAALAFALALSPQTVELTPTDDVWVYPHATDVRDPYLRVWGAEGRDVAKDVNELEDFGYSYLRFDVSKIPSGKIVSASLTVTHIADPGFDLAYAKQNPLRARPLPGDFREKTWDYNQTDQLRPEIGPDLVFGDGAPRDIPDGKEFPIIIDLTKGPNKFQTYLNNARKSGGLDLALTASMDVEERGQRCIYKFYSRDWETAAKRPVLKLTIEAQ